MAYYTVMTTAWNGATQPPNGDLAALVASFDSATALWTTANGYPALNTNDTTAAGLS